MYVYVLELSIVSELLWFEREKEEKKAKKRKRKRKQREKERRTHERDRPLRNGLLWQARMCRMSYKKARMCGH